MYSRITIEKNLMLMVKNTLSKADAVPCRGVSCSGCPFNRANFIGLYGDKFPELVPKIPKKFSCYLSTVAGYYDVHVTEVAKHFYSDLVGTSKSKVRKGIREFKDMLW